MLQLAIDPMSFVWFLCVSSVRFVCYFCDCKSVHLFAGWSCAEPVLLTHVLVVLLAYYFESVLYWHISLSALLNVWNLTDRQPVWLVVTLTHVVVTGTCFMLTVVCTPVRLVVHRQRHHDVIVRCTFHFADLCCQ